MIKKAHWYKSEGDIHLLNVQPSIPYGSRVSSVVGHDVLEQYHREEGLKALQGRRKSSMPRD